LLLLARIKNKTKEKSLFWIFHFLKLEATIKKVYLAAWATWGIVLTYSVCACYPIQCSPFRARTFNEKAKKFGACKRKMKIANSNYDCKREEIQQ